MTDSGKNISVAVCGLVTSMLTAIAVSAIADVTGFNLFTFGFWVVVPVGALLLGFAAASGYYFGSLFFHKRPSWWLCLQMVVVAGLTQFLIYYLGYISFTFEDGRHVSQLIPFTQYLAVTLSSAHYRIGRTFSDVGEVGSFGYWLAAFQFMGFLVGGFCVFGLLLAKPICQQCNLYQRVLAKLKKTYSDAESASPYYDGLLRYSPSSLEFTDLICGKAQAKVQKGALQITSVLHGCPSCDAQVIVESVRINNGREWKDVRKLARRIPIPHGTDLTPFFS